MNNSTRANARELFLGALMDGFTVSKACERADIDRKTAYNWRNAETEFAEAWDDALEAGSDKLEDEAYRRAHDGVAEPIVGMGRVVMGSDGQPLTVQKYSDGLLTLLLKARRPDKFKDRVANESKVDINIQAGGISGLLEAVKNAAATKPI